MYYIYVLQSINDKSLYIGKTKDLNKRLAEHNRGGSRYTRNLAPLRLVYYEAYNSELDARERENKLKHHGSVVGHLKRRLTNSLVN